MRLAIASMLAAALGGCYASGGVGYSAGYVAPAPVYTTHATVSVETYEPDLVEVSPGVQVIVDYEEPVFYSDNYYWRYSGNVWYRSHVHTGGWAIYNDVPHRVRTIERPHTYARYRPQGYVPRQRGRDHRTHDQGRVRDYRSPQPQPTVRDYRSPQPQPYDRGPTVRDHRTPQPQPYDRGPTVRDHRTPQPQPYDRGPTVRDHRTPQPQPPVRDYRSPQPQPPPHDRGPTVRDHRTPQPQPYTPGPTVRDHRTPTGQPPARSGGARPPAKDDDRDDRKSPSPYRKR